ncbi:MAG: hypothetical protein FWH36_03195 [Lentimicrobiaceae bacterium]|nr:hypothetical protein [Lentimicrobiaceae bacterium]
MDIKTPFMKHFSCFLVFIFFCVGINNAFAVADTLQSKLILTNDSGFVTKNEGLDFLLANSLMDTNDFLYLTDSNVIEEYIKKKNYDGPVVKIPVENDTIGKYYRMENSDNYIVCLVYYSARIKQHIHCLMEINSNGELVKNEKFYLGLFITKIPYDIFYRYGDFFALENLNNRICFGDYGYLGLYLFKEVRVL